MEGLTVAFIGHRKIEDEEGVTRKLYNVVERLIAGNNAVNFLFGSKSRFNGLCYDVVNDLKTKYPHIRRIELRSCNEFLDGVYLKLTLEDYEETRFPDKVRGAGKSSYIRRNEAMIDMCDIAVVYYDKTFVPHGLGNVTNSGTKLAVEYAVRKKKRIINLCEL